MKLNDLFNAEFTAWEDIFIEHKGENEIIESMTNYIDLASYDDSRNCKNTFENDCRVIEQYDINYGEPIFSNLNEDYGQDDEPEIEFNNDTRVMVEWDEDLFEQYYNEIYIKYLHTMGYSVYQIERRWKLNKIRKIMKGKK
jgi:hypothetical protein